MNNTVDQDILGTSQPDARLRVLAATACGTNSCPTIFESSPGKIVVQGYVVPPDSAGITVPDGEMLVEVPTALLIEALRKLS